MSDYNEHLPRTDAYGNRLFFARGIYVSRTGKYITKPKEGASYNYYHKPRIDKILDVSILSMMEISFM